MQFQPNYKPANEAWRDLVNSLTEKQQAIYRSTNKLPKTKRVDAELKRIADIRSECHAKFVAWYEKFQANFSGELDAKVLWFNKNSGEGSVEITGKDGTTQRSEIYACNIKGKKTWYPETACVYYVENQQVKISLDFQGRCGPIFVVGLTQGTFDQEHWDKIKDSGLAFRCDEDGKAVNGLFA
jgi:hypothetical protein